MTPGRRRLLLGSAAIVVVGAVVYVTLSSGWERMRERVMGGDSPKPEPPPPSERVEGVPGPDNSITTLDGSRSGEPQPGTGGDPLPNQPNQPEGVAPPPPPAPAGEPAKLPGSGTVDGRPSS